jgi:heme exporter protein D
MLATFAPYIVAASAMTFAALAALILHHVVEHLDPPDVGPLTNAPGKQ